ncbi:hypothetical protein [Candidatus Magnetomonas plexicatena]|uniref:hypothetical protein n=1 Tax=Candidatus Magnetomonas plexicatena TaxID=2552947 RepID=UPI001100B746|nr:hypothetical protein E2O03_007495 [Nitrospirales bacterium LBB_01]
MVVKNMLEFMFIASKFVENNKGVCDSKAWLNFNSEIQKRGMSICDDTVVNAGGIVEAMRKYYMIMLETNGMTNILGGVSDATAKFLKATNGKWTHSDWENYIEALQAKGVEMNDEALKHLGALVEASKQCFIGPYFM